MAAKSEEFIEQGKDLHLKLLTCKVYKTCRFNTTKLILSSKRSCSKFRTMIIISSPTPQVGEIETIHSLFENGLELLHVRKPEFTNSKWKFCFSN
jgi:hypothetical protein